jgi:L-alanine-DL-glutamate epimerase-like enolase superfamily enzyme
VPVYSGGGYYPRDDLARLRAEIQAMQALGYQQVKIKIGGAPLAQDGARIEAVLALHPAAHLAVDAMNAYDAAQSREAAQALAHYGLVGGRL